MGEVDDTGLSPGNARFAFAFESPVLVGDPPTATTATVPAAATAAARPAFGAEEPGYLERRRVEDDRASRTAARRPVSGALPVAAVGKHFA